MSSPSRMSSKVRVRLLLCRLSLWMEGVKYLNQARELVAMAEPPIRVIPCLQEEIQALEVTLDMNLPAAYREFLSWMGKDGGPIMRGSQCLYKYIPDIQGWARELLVEDHCPKSLPTDAFVIWMHQGYQFAFIRTTEGKNPPVYIYHEMHNQQDFILLNNSFSDFVVESVKGSLEFWKTHPNWHVQHQAK